MVGETPNLAARLQAAAEPNSVFIATSTRRLLGGLFECTDLGERQLKGFSAPIGVWQVLGEGAAASRFEAKRTADDLTPFVGRDPELERLLDCWQKAKRSEGQVVLVSGEPGIGKSRLVQTLRERVLDERHTRLNYHGSPFYCDSALHPVIDQLERAAGLSRDDRPEQRLAKLETLLAQSALDVDAAMPLVAALLSVPTGDRYPLLAMTPQRQKDETLQTLLTQLAGLAVREPVLMMFEDAHWFDPTSIELLGLAIDRVRHLPVLVVITFRPEFVPPWTGQAHVTSLLLERLSRRQGAKMVARLTEGRALPTAIFEQIVVRTDGVPLFVEELTKMVLESGLLRDQGDHYELAGPLPPLAIPATLQDSLMARLDRLAPVKEVAQIGAAIGREFSYELLATVAPLDERELLAGLDQLACAGLLFRKDMPDQSQTYTFKHALVQEAAYQSLLRSKRQRLHARIGSALEEQFPETAETKPELLAHHWELAKVIAKAVGYRLRAGHRASARSAAPEAIAQLHKGLQLLEGIPPGPERDRQELLLQLALFSVQVGVRGYAAPETGTALTRAGELCGSAGDRSLIFPVLYGQRGFHFVRAELDVAREINEEMLRLACESGDSAAQMTGHGLLGEVFCSRGDFSLGRAQLEKALALYDPEQHHSLTFLYGQSPRVTALCWLSWTLLFSGYPEQALRRIGEATADAGHLSHFNTLAYALIFSAAVHYEHRNRQATQERSEALISLCTDQRLFFWLGAAHCLHGWALAHGGHPEDGIAELNQGIAAYRATGGELFMPFLLAVHAETRQKTGHPGEDLLDLLSEAASRTSMTGERCYEAELHRLRGECVLSLASSDQAVAEASFQQAIEVARHQKAKMWELRGAASLARLWRRQGRYAEARDLLAPIYSWFTEGFEVRDLADARELFVQLK